MNGAHPTRRLELLLVKFVPATPRIDRSCGRRSPFTLRSVPSFARHIAGQNTEAKRHPLVREFQTVLALLDCAVGSERESDAILWQLQFAFLTLRPSGRRVSGERHSSGFRPAFPRSPRSVLLRRPAGTSRLCFSGSFHNKSPAQQTARLRPWRARFVAVPSQKAPLALGSRAPRAASRTGVPSDIRAKTLRRK